MNRNPAEPAVIPMAMVCTIALATAVPAFAHETDAAASPSAKPAASANVKVVPAASLVAVKDPVTGELRAPTAEEAAALVESARTASFARTAAPQPRTYTTPGGGRGLTLGEATFGLAVARKRADGKVVEACVPDAQQAARFFADPGPSHE